jgi:hypothetical protein
MAWRFLQQAVGWFGWFAGLYYAFLVAWTILKKDRPEQAKFWLKFLVKLRKARDNSEGLLHVALAILLALLTHRHPH